MIVKNTLFYLLPFFQLAKRCSCSNSSSTARPFEGMLGAEDDPSVNDDVQAVCTDARDEYGDCLKFAAGLLYEPGTMVLVPSSEGWDASPSPRNSPPPFCPGLKEYLNEQSSSPGCANKSIENGQIPPSLGYMDESTEDGEQVSPSLGYMDESTEEGEQNPSSPEHGNESLLSGLMARALGDGQIFTPIGFTAGNEDFSLFSGHVDAALEDGPQFRLSSHSASSSSSLKSVEKSKKSKSVSKTAKKPKTKKAKKPKNKEAKKSKTKEAKKSKTKETKKPKTKARKTKKAKKSKKPEKPEKPKKERESIMEARLQKVLNSRLSYVSKLTELVVVEKISPKARVDDPIPLSRAWLGKKCVAKKVPLPERYDVRSFGPTSNLEIVSLIAGHQRLVPGTSCDRAYFRRETYKILIEKNLFQVIPNEQNDNYKPKPLESLDGKYIQSLFKKGNNEGGVIGVFENDRLKIHSSHRALYRAILYNGSSITDLESGSDTLVGEGNILFIVPDGVTGKMIKGCLGKDTLHKEVLGCIVKEFFDRFELHADFVMTTIGKEKTGEDLPEQNISLSSPLISAPEAIQEANLEPQDAESCQARKAQTSSSSDDAQPIQAKEESRSKKLAEILESRLPDSYVAKLQEITVDKERTKSESKSKSKSKLKVPISLAKTWEGETGGSRSRKPNSSHFDSRYFNATDNFGIVSVISGHKHCDKRISAELAFRYKNYGIRINEDSFQVIPELKNLPKNNVGAASKADKNDKKKSPNRQKSLRNCSEKHIKSLFKDEKNEGGVIGQFRNNHLKIYSSPRPFYQALLYNGDSIIKLKPGSDTLISEDGILFILPHGATGTMIKECLKKGVLHTEVLGCIIKEFQATFKLLSGDYIMAKIGRREPLEESSSESSKKSLSKSLNESPEKSLSESLSESPKKPLKKSPKKPLKKSPKKPLKKSPKKPLKKSPKKSSSKSSSESS